jgi:uncharacterized protein (DUF58 family)
MRSTTAPVPGTRHRLTREGLAWVGTAALLAALAWLKSLNVLLLIAYMMFGLLALNGLLSRRQVRRVTASRLPLPPVYAGEEGRVRVVVRNRGDYPVTVSVVEPGVGASSNWVLAGLVAGASVECSRQVSFPHRGRVELPAPVVTSGFPFGFLQCNQPGEGRDEVVVLPEVGGADPVGMWRWLQRHPGNEGRTRKILRVATADQADVRGIRPYRPGDSIRAVHWRSTARRRELMVREYDTAPTSELVLVVEPWLPRVPSERDLGNLEAALSLAATIIRTSCLHLDTRITVVLAGVESIVRAGPPTEASARVATAPLATAEGVDAPGPVDPAVFGRGFTSAVRVVVSSRPASPLATSLTRTTGRLFVAIDPSIGLPWYQPPRTASGVKPIRNDQRQPKSPFPILPPPGVELRT